MLDLQCVEWIHNSVDVTIVVSVELIKGPLSAWNIELAHTGEITDLSVPIIDVLW